MKKLLEFRESVIRHFNTRHITFDTVFIQLLLFHYEESCYCANYMFVHHFLKIYHEMNLCQITKTCLIRKWRHWKIWIWMVCLFTVWIKAFVNWITQFDVNMLISLQNKVMCRRCYWIFMVLCRISPCSLIHLNLGECCVCVCLCVVFLCTVHIPSPFVP